AERRSDADLVVLEAARHVQVALVHRGLAARQADAVHLEVAELVGDLQQLIGRQLLGRGVTGVVVAVDAPQRARVGDLPEDEARSRKCRGEQTHTAPIGDRHSDQIDIHGGPSPQPGELPGPAGFTWSIVAAGGRAVKRSRTWSLTGDSAAVARLRTRPE